MKKLTNYKQLIIGLIIGAATTLSISALAEYVIESNPYPVTLNGARIDIEGYNINGYTYFKLRDVGDKVGFGVDFQNDTICINRAGSTSNNTSTNNNNDKILQPIISVSEIPPKATTVNPKIAGMEVFAKVEGEDLEYTSDGIALYTHKSKKELPENKQYVHLIDVELAYKETDFYMPYIYELMFKLDSSKVVLEDYADYFIEYEYYETAVLPYIKSLQE